MRKFLAIALLISFVAPASAGSGFINGLGKVPNSGFVSDGSKASSFTPTDQQTKRFKPFWDQVAREQQLKARQKQLDNAQAQSDQSKATAKDSQDRVRNVKDTVKKMLEQQAQSNNCIGCR